MEEDATLDPSLGSASAPAKAPAGDSNHGWQKVTYGRRQRRPQPQPQPSPASFANGPPDRSHVFASVEQMALERRRAIESESASAAVDAGPTRSRVAAAASDDEDEDSGDDAAPEANENGAEFAKKVKQKKPKKPKVTVAEAAAKIDAEDLCAFLADISASYESQQNIQLMRFADYFARSFSSVSAPQFPWAKMFRESTLSKIADVPLCHISESIYKISADWISEKSPECLGDFILWCLDSILADLATQQATAKGLKKHVTQSPKPQVAIFVVLAMALRRKPDILISILPKIRENPKYHGQEKLPIIVWAIAQVSQGDPVSGMYLWTHFLFPAVCEKSSVNPQSRDLVLQLVERIFTGPKARPILLNGAVRKGERLVPPAAFDLLMRNSFAAPSARIKATERFEAIYPTLKELALAGSPGTKTTKQASQQLLPLTMQAIQEGMHGNSELAKEATDIFIWCLLQNSECFRQWEKLHIENVNASVAVLRKLTNEWKNYADKLSSDTLRVTLEHLKAKNEEALSGDSSASKQTSIKDADKYTTALSRKLRNPSGCIKSGMVLMVIIAICLALAQNVGLLEREKLYTVLQSFSFNNV